jgi:hypothetical protein
VAPNGIELHPVVNIVLNSNPNPTPDFSITTSPTSVLLNAGTSVNVSVSIAALAGFNSPVSLSVSGAPPGITATFNPSTVAPNGTGTLALAADPSLLPGNYSLVVNGSGGGTSHTAALQECLRMFSPGGRSYSVAVHRGPPIENAIHAVWCLTTQAVSFCGAFYSIYDVGHSSQSS